MNIPGANHPGAPASRRHARWRWLPPVAALIAIAIFVSAGNWQGRRMHEKERLRAQFDAASRSAPAPLPPIAAASEWAGWRYRQLRVEGEYDAARQIFIDNKVHGGRAGYHVVTPLRSIDGRVVLINRGWVVQGPSRSALPAMPPPAGRVAVHGRINLPVVGYLELDRQPPVGALWQNLDPARYSAATGVAVLPIVIEEIAAGGSGDGLVRDWPAPDFGVDKHRGYRMQWYALAAVTGALALFFQFRRRKPGAPP